MPEVMNDELTSVIIPQHGCWEQTVECCAGLLRLHAEQRLEVIVVDDGSPAEDRRQVRRFLPASVQILEQAHQGVTAAWNAGLQAARGELLVLLNNDVRTQRPWVGQLSPLLSEPVRVLGPRRHGQRLGQTLWPGCRVPAAEERFLQGWCLAFRRRTWEAVGPFDERMRLYWSDTDWLLRCLLLNSSPESGCSAGNLGAGFGLLPSGSLQHQGHVSTRRLAQRRTWWRSDRAAFVAKWCAPQAVSESEQTAAVSSSGSTRSGAGAVKLR